VLEDLAHVPRHAPADEQHLLRVGVCQQREVSHLLGECPPSLKGQQTVLVEDALSVARLHREAAIGGVGGKDQIGPLPAEGGDAKGVAQGTAGPE